MPGKVLVVGAAGFMGRSISQRLIDEGYEVHGVSRVKPDLNFSGFTLGRSDTIKNIDSLIGDVFPEAIEVLRFAELCEAADVSKFIMISSGGTIYGEGGGSKKVETDRLQPLSPYGYMHLLVDKGLCQINTRQKMRLNTGYPKLRDERCGLYNSRGRNICSRLHIYR